MVLEETLESHLDCKEIQPVPPEGNLSWIFIGRTDAEAEAPILWPPDAKSWLWCWERLKAGGEGDNRGWDGWMASPTLWTWVWASSGSWWWTGKPGVLQSMGSQRGRHDWATEVNWTHDKSWEWIACQAYIPIKGFRQCWVLLMMAGCWSREPQLSLPVKGAFVKGNWAVRVGLPLTYMKNVLLCTTVCHSHLEGLAWVQALAKPSTLTSGENFYLLVGLTFHGKMKGLAFREVFSPIRSHLLYLWICPST